MWTGSRVRALPFVSALAVAAAVALPLPASADPPPVPALGRRPGRRRPVRRGDPEHPDKLVGFDVEIAELVARGLGRDAAVRVRRVHVDRPVRRPRRRRHRAERHRGHAGPPRGDGRHGPVLRVPRGAERPRRRSRRAFARWPTLRGRRVGTLGGTIAYDILLPRRARARHPAPCPTTTTCTPTRTWCSAGSMPCCSTTCSPSAGDASAASPFSTAGRGRHRALRRRARAGQRGAARRRRRDPARRRCATARWSASSASGTCGTTISRRSIARVLAGTPIAPVTGIGARGRPRRACRRWDGRPALPAVAPARPGDHVAAVVPGDGAGGGARRADRERARLRRPPVRGAA